MNEKQIFDYLVKGGLTEAGAAGLMGNLIAESGLRSNNLQNNFETTLGMDDETYTKAVDTGIYQDFVRDSAGYGLAQWTYWTRKQNLLDFAKKQGKSIGDCQMQLDFLLQEIREYTAVWNTLKTANNIKAASDMVLLQYEKPANQSESVRQTRASLGQGVYDRCKGISQVNQTIVQDITTGKTRSYSPLIVSQVEFGTINCNPRKNRVVRITPHHMAGVMTGEACAKMHMNPARQASANYYVGNDGDICGGVRETERAWTSGTGNGDGTNDHTAITIEISNDKTGGDWTISKKAYDATIRLCADICDFYGIDPHYDGTKNGTITTHDMFQATTCPGPYLKRLITSGQFERDIKAAMKSKSNPIPTVNPIPVSASSIMYRVQVGAFQEKTNADKLAAELKAKGETCLVMRAGTSYKVQVGAFSNFENAKRKSEALMRAGYKTYISEVSS